MIKIISKCRKMKRSVTVDEARGVGKKLALEKNLTQIVLYWNFFNNLGTDNLFSIETIPEPRIKGKTSLFISLILHNSDETW